MWIGVCILTFSILAFLFTLNCYFTNNSSNNTYETFQQKEEEQQYNQILSQLYTKMQIFVNKLVLKYPDNEAVNRLKNKSQNVRISRSNDKKTYTVNKGEHIHFCLEPEDKDDNVLTFVLLHEYGHIMCKSQDHTPEFWNFFRFLQREAADLIDFEIVDYSKHPAFYCGMKIHTNPLFTSGTAQETVQQFSNILKNQQV